MATRLGEVLYRTACIAAALWAMFVLVIAPALAQPDWTIFGHPLRASALLLFGALVVPLAIFYPVAEF
ncbi:MAG: hypothetical protein WB586_15240 [Chthoniobacterales bacterium]